MGAPSDSLVVLREGVVAPLGALELLWDLEARGLRVTLEGDVLAVGPRSQITDADREAIRQYREHLQAVVLSCEREQ